MEEQSKKIGVTLSGGAAKAIAHIGVLQAMEENDIRPQLICGTSAGAIVGVLYASGLSPQEILDIGIRSTLWKILKFMIPWKGLTNHSYLQQLLEKNVGKDSFEELKIPFCIGVTNLNDARHEIHDRGPLFDLVKASCAIPGIFEPIQIDNKYYVDGGVTNNMPARALANKCDILIGSNVISAAHRTPKDLRNVRRIVTRVFEVSLLYRSYIDSGYCDMLIQAPGLDAYGMFDFGKSKDIYQAGYDKTIEKMPQIKAMLDTVPA